LKQVIATVISNSQVMPGVYLVWLQSPQTASIAQPGQFVMVLCGDDTLLRRPLSIHQRDGSKIALLFEVVGKGTAWLSRCKAGDSVDIFGPLGNGFALQPEAKNILMISGGIGIAPLPFLAQKAVERKCSIKLLAGAKTSAQLDIEHLFPEETEIIFTREDIFEGKGRMGKVTILIPDYADWVDQVFACGPPGMYQTMARMPDLKGKQVQISLEIMMGCGRGVCYGCTIRTKSGLKKVCQDGPVFDFDDILWEELT